MIDGLYTIYDRCIGYRILSIDGTDLRLSCSVVYSLSPPCLPFPALRESVSRNYPIGSYVLGPPTG
jgi:hypothetical protein